jgi:hypothetical protein
LSTIRHYKNDSGIEARVEVVKGKDPFRLYKVKSRVIKVRDFPTELAAVNAYEDFLVRETECEWVPSGRRDERGDPICLLIDHGNTIKLNDRPQVILDNNGECSDLVGSW